MKRISFIIVFVCASICIWAQNGHLKFQGIPIDGPLVEFQQKLIDKGYTPDEEYNKSTDAKDNRLFTGLFSGLNSEVYVTYSSSNQLVYLVTVVIKTSSEDVMLKLYDQIKESLKSSYPKAFMETDEYEGYDAITFYLRRFSSDTEMKWRRCYGSIGLACYKSDNTYNVFLDFTDQKNGDLHEKGKK